jgi:sec-independent protein translocase protein TatC
MKIDGIKNDEMKNDDELKDDGMKDDGMKETKTRETEGMELHWTEHLAELRRRLLVVFGVFLAAFCGAFLCAERLYLWLTRDVEQPLQVLGPTDVLWVYVMIAGVAAITVTIPAAAYHVWRFVAPGLSREEIRLTLAYIPVMTLLFVIGLCFGYFLVYPMVLSFLNGMSAPFTAEYTAQSYLRFMLHMTVPFGFLFELPVAVMFLTSLGVLHPERMAKMRKMAYLLLTVTAVTITPPDLISDVLVIVPLLALYEASVGLSRLMRRRKQTRLAVVGSK